MESDLQMSINDKLFCNVKNCHVPLSSTAWITCCYHIFCNDHSPAYNDETEKRCPSCQNYLLSNADLIKVNLELSKKHKSILLAGYSPSTIKQFVFNALCFWNFQMLQEKLYLKTSVKDMQNRLVRSEYDYEATITGLKKNIQQERQKCEKLEKEVNILMKKVRQAEAKTEYKQRQQLSNIRIGVNRKQQKPLHLHLHQNSRRNEPEKYLILNPQGSVVRSKISPNFINRVENLNVGYISSSQPLPQTQAFKFNPILSQQRKS